MSESSCNDIERYMDCIFFDQDAFLDVRMLAADQRQTEWRDAFLPEIKVTSNIQVIYSRVEAMSKEKCIWKKDADILKKMSVQDMQLLGSSHDGLYLEKGFPIVDLNKGEVNETDIDVVFQFKGVDIRQTRLPLEYQTPYLLVENSKFPGYVNLQIMPNHSPESPVYFEPLALKRQLFYAVTNAKFVVYESDQHRQFNDFTEFLRSGPALHGAIEDELGIHFIDYVASLSMKEWPRVAKSFVTRERTSGWPSPDMIQEITSRGCGFVAVGHPLSPTTNLEWRVSFSDAERMLIRKLNSVQIRAYLFLKSFFKLRLSEPAVLTSYMMKNVLLWVMELVPLDTWRQDKMLDCVEALIDLLTVYLEDAFIPNYFVPNRNMIRHKAKRDIMVLFQNVKVIQEDVLTAVFECADELEFQGMRDISLSKLQHRLLSASKDEVRMTLGLSFFIMHVSIRLQAIRYLLKLSFKTFCACVEKDIACLLHAVPPRAVWYFTESLKLLPDMPLLTFHNDGETIVLDVTEIRRRAAEFIKAGPYDGLLKAVIDDQEFVTDTKVTVMPTMRTLIDWVDMTSVWNGGLPLCSDHLYAPDIMD